MQITIEEMKALASGHTAENTPTNGSPLTANTQIVVLDRGFVYVGVTTIEGDFVRITNARNIRCWGTTNGLGELVDGPKKETKLDQVGEIVAPMKSVIHFIKCNRDW